MTTTTITSNQDDGYIVQRATKIVTAFNNHLAADCDHCKSMLQEIYKNESKLVSGNQPPTQNPIPEQSTILAGQYQNGQKHISQSK